MRWRPVADLAVRRRSEHELRRLAGLLREPNARASVALATGDAGTAVFFAYLARSTLRIPDAAAVACRYADRAAHAVATTAMPLGLLTGAAGIAWMLQHLRGRELPRRDACGAFDAALVDAVTRGTLDADPDLVSGLSGIGVYALARQNRPLLTAVVARLAARGRAEGDALVWPEPGGDPVDQTPSPPRLAALVDRKGEAPLLIEEPVGSARLAALVDRKGEAPLPTGGAGRAPPPRLATLVDAGTAHGMAGIIAVVSQASVLGIARAGELHQRASRWLRAQAQWRDQASVFPDMVRLGQPRAADCRLAWCRGDIGVACALASAADATADRVLGAEAAKIAGHAAARTVDRSGVVDRGVCHGAAGVALGLQRMFSASGARDLGEAAGRWYARALDDAVPEATLDAEAAIGRGLLGAAGLGLAYLAAATPVLPRWCSVLAMLPVGSPEPRRRRA